MGSGDAQRKLAKTLPDSWKQTVVYNRPFFLFFICLGEKDKTPETITFWDGLQPAAEFSSVSDPQGPLYMTRQKEHAVVLSFFFLFFFLAMLCWGLPSHPIRWLAT